MKRHHLSGGTEKHQQHSFLVTKLSHPFYILRLRVDTTFNCAPPPSCHPCGFVLLCVSMVLQHVLRGVRTQLTCMRRTCLHRAHHKILLWFLTGNGGDEREGCWYETRFNHRAYFFISPFSTFSDHNVFLFFFPCQKRN